MEVLLALQPNAVNNLRHGWSGYSHRQKIEPARRKYMHSNAFEPHVPVFDLYVCACGQEISHTVVAVGSEGQVKGSLAVDRLGEQSCQNATSSSSLHRVFVDIIIAAAATNTSEAAVSATNKLRIKQTHHLAIHQGSQESFRGSKPQHVNHQLRVTMVHGIVQARPTGSEMEREALDERACQDTNT